MKSVVESSETMVDLPHWRELSAPARMVMQCYHEGCQWRELTAENKRQAALILELSTGDETVTELNEDRNRLRAALEGARGWLQPPLAAPGHALKIIDEALAGGVSHVLDEKPQGSPQRDTDRGPPHCGHGAPFSERCYVCEAGSADETSAPLTPYGEQLEQFVRRIAEYDDYTHDAVSEPKILQALQHDAQKLLHAVETSGDAK